MHFAPAAIVFTLVLGANAALAQSRQSTVSLSCGQAQGIVQRQGAAVLGTGGDTFDRFVRDQSFCPKGQILKATFVPTRDAPQCLVGWRCVDNSVNFR